MTKIQISIAKKRPDIAQLMINYNVKYNVKEGNDPNEIGYGSTKDIHIRCDNCHDLTDTANKISSLKTDKYGKYYCRECESLGLVNVEKDNLQGITLKEFCTDNPDHQYLLDEWDYNLNHITPDDITTGSEKKFFWKCAQNHSYTLDVFSRARRGRGCPYCNGRKLLKGFNDLASQNPQILKDWNYDKNKVKPDEIFQHAKRKVWWKCHKCGHEWEATVCRRTTNIQTGCPNCHGRATSLPEMCLYITLKNVFKHVEHRKVINGLEYDIVINKPNIAIEYDGVRFHGEKIGKREKLKEKNAKSEGLLFIRIKETADKTLHEKFINNTLYISEQNRHHHDNTCKALLNLINNLFHLNIDCNVEKDITIMARSAIDLNRKENSIALMYPEHAKEWYQPLNGNIKPEYVTHGNNNVSFWWKCSKCGHIYQKTPYDKRNTFKKGGCSKCTNSFHKTSVVCVTTDKFYSSISEATQDTGINYASISCVCAGKQKTAGKLHWRYATEQEIKEQRVINT